ncbi:hypothetical protein FNQ90_22165 [Streptomyces alkaliphilus]|uniref:DUF5667 domain-containing protein n=1 Tax=Streptomyces alkaliphilus TaxID=1472722 RepID=A0A7W3Y3L9_9ACTN|nr:DUF5667 domain-containing protein [Streptomyces alkaliphilus]MBB0246748.1 hypothetical protein [Streptomyces alkaliphilus]
MIGSVSTHRRAGAFAAAVAASEDAPANGAAPAAPPASEVSPYPAPGASDPTPGRASAEPSPEEFAPLLRVVDGMRALPPPRMDPRTRAVQRAQLVAALEAAFAEGGATALGAPSTGPDRPRGAHRAGPARGFGALRPRSRLTKGLAAGGLTVGVAAGAFGGAAAASTNALPGDTLYGLKRGMEDLRLDLAGGQHDRGRIHLNHASTRLNEARRLMERGRSGPLESEQVAEVRAALTAMAANTVEGHRLLVEAHEQDGSVAPLRTLSDFSERHRETWADLRPQLPPALNDIGVEVTRILEALREEVVAVGFLLREDEEAVTTEPSPELSPSADGTPDTAPPDPTFGPSGANPPGGIEEEGGPVSTGTAPPESVPAPPSGEEQRRPPAGDGGAPGGEPEDGTTGPDPTEPVPTEPGAEITLPPLIDGLLPGLGIDVRSTDRS